MKKEGMAEQGTKIIVLVMVAATLGTLMLAVNVVGPGIGDSQTFFQQFVISGGPIVWFVLLPMSVFTVYLMLSAAVGLRKKTLLPENIESEVLMAIRTGSFMWLNSARRDDLLSDTLCRSLGGDCDQPLSQRFADNLQNRAAALMRKIEPLNIIGNIAPMVGLFGTVFGMIKLFNAIVVAGGQPQPAQLAEGISVALVTTFWGLLIAIPALAFYGAMAGRIEGFITTTANSARQVLAEASALTEDLPQDQSQYSAAISQFADSRKRTP